MGLFLEINDQLAGIVQKVLTPASHCIAAESDGILWRILFFRMTNMGLHISAGIFCSPTGYV